MRARTYRDNSELIRAAEQLGHIRGRVLDATYGGGVFWNLIRPPGLVSMDAFPSAPVRVVGDFTHSPFRCRSFDTVVYDPPYKLNGTPDDDPDGSDRRYGVGDYTRWQDRMALIMVGVADLAPLVANQGRLLVKVMDQVCSGAMRFQTDDVRDVAVAAGLIKVERLDYLNDPRTQPTGGKEQPDGTVSKVRQRKHADANYSSLLIFKRAGRRPSARRPAAA